VALFVLRFPRLARLLARLLRDPRVHFLAKAIFLSGAAYAVAPTDFLADFFPILGQLDDLAILALAGRLFVQLSPPAVVAEHEAAVVGTRTATANVGQLQEA
jgi:uncharacterized membrane protein YkvA (DUF1232 family)